MLCLCQEAANREGGREGAGTVAVQNGRALPRAEVIRSRPEVRYFRVAKGRNVFREGDRANAVFTVELGCVRLDVERADGEHDVVGFLFKGDSFSPGISTYWVSAHAVTDVLLSCAPLRIAADDGAQGEADFPPDRLARDVVHRLSFIKRLPANARLLWFVKWLSARTGRGEPLVVEMPMTSRDLANFLGIAPETVSRGFADLERRGHLKRLRHHCVELTNWRPLVEARASGVA